MRRTPLLLMFALIALAPAALAASKPKPPADGKALGAYLVKISGTTLMVSIGNAGTEVLIPTDERTVFTLEGEPAKLSDLKPQMLLRIVQEEGLTKTVDARAAKVRK
ncbi:MAG TPA: hypothetical protein VEA69_04065 [Tepidisphaeraceae bacterium]|nr:hypothetical protein [Tepidisphaeraceae bacterium]